MNGAGCEGGRELFASLGVPYEHLYGEPHGVFARPAEPIPAHLGDLCDRVRNSDAVVGFAQDPDADRLVLVDERGVPIHEECTLALAATWVLRHRGPGVLVANLSTSRMIDRIAEEFSGAKVVRSAVGEANVVDVMEQSNAILGGEGNGGVIDPEVVKVRDSITGMAMVLDLLAEEGRPLSALVADLPALAMVKEKRDLSSIGGRSAVPEVLAAVRSTFADGQVNDLDGVRVTLAEGWVHVRPSNTEPIVRVIAEADTKDQAEALVARVTQAANL